MLFGIHKRNTKPAIPKIEEVINGLEDIYNFDKQCVQDVKAFYSMQDEELAQGPQGDVSKVVIKDEKRLLMGLKSLYQVFADSCPHLIEKFDVRSILTLCVENVFSEIRSGGLDMPLQLDFDRKFPRAVKERLKRQCQCSFNYFTHVDTYYPKITSLVPFNTLPKPPKVKTVHLSKEKIETMKCWRAEHGQSVPQKTVRNLSTKDNPGTLPVNLYQRKKIALKPIDLDNFHQATERHPKGNQANVQSLALYEAQNVVCMKAERLKMCRLLEGIMLSECGTRSPKKVKANNFKRDPFNSNTFYKLGGATIDTGDVICLVENVTYSRDESSLTIEEETYYSLLAHVLDQKDLASKDELRYEENEPHVQKKIRRSLRKRKRTFQDCLAYDEDSE